VIAFQPVGDISHNDLMLAADAVADAFGADVTTAPAIPLPPDAYDPARNQYLARVIVDALARHRRPGWARLLGVVDEDLYAPGLNFVFGEADSRRGVAVFSLARLRDSAPHGADETADRFRQRAATEAVHELGHTYGLSHCRDPHCVMWFSNTLAETDRKGTRFCSGHQAELAVHLER
jgi:archaemetzincin